MTEPPPKPSTGAEEAPPLTRRRRRRLPSAARAAQKSPDQKPQGQKFQSQRGRAESPPAKKPRRRLRVVAAVIEEEGRVLVSLRHPKKQRPSQWEFPGGKMEKGETEQEALAREIQEELGVKAKIRRLLARVVHPFADTDVEIAFYETAIVEGEPQPLVMAELRWVPREELPSMDFLEADKGFVEALARGEELVFKRRRSGRRR